MEQERQQRTTRNRLPPRCPGPASEELYVCVHDGPCGERPLFLLNNELLLENNWALVMQMVRNHWRATRALDPRAHPPYRPMGAICFYRSRARFFWETPAPQRQLRVFGHNGRIEFSSYDGSRLAALRAFNIFFRGLVESEILTTGMR